ncbi:MAG: hypothetical protein R3F29_02645 [Planctomycetota bacterium]
MSDDTLLREAARERLFDGALADAVRAEGGTSGATLASRRLLHAALLLLGIAVTATLAVWHGPQQTTAQDPEAFDPLRPRVENEWLWGERPPVASDHAQFATLLADASLRKLSISSELELADDDWRRLGQLQALEYLRLPLSQCSAHGLRELRHAPNLRALHLSGTNGGGTFDLAVATTLLELPHLTCLMLVLCPLETAALRKLSGLPDLHSLYFESCTTEPTWTSALRDLRGLRWLRIIGRLPDPADTLTARQLRELSAAPQLTTLHLVRFDLDEGDLADLPPTLQFLEVRPNTPLSAAALRTLVARPDLRGLRLSRLSDADRELLHRALPETRLERFSTQGTLGAELQQVLAEQSTLRRIGFEVTGSGAPDLDFCSRLQHLEQLDLSMSEIPADGLDLSALRALRHLRRVTFFGANARESLTPEALGAMHDSLGPDVELVVW